MEKKGKKRRTIVLVETPKIEENSLKKGVSWEEVITHMLLGTLTH